GGGAEERREVDVLLQLGHVLPAVGERHDEEEGEEHLDAGQRDPKLAQELDQLPVDPLLLAFPLGDALIMAKPRFREEHECASSLQSPRSPGSLPRPSKGSRRSRSRWASPTTTIRRLT